ncbi:MAG: hypothetical protein AVDCRST_MAG91-497, partial [uncultured Sphingomonadaceae bacterium]
ENRFPSLRDRVRRVGRRSNAVRRRRRRGGRARSRPVRRYARGYRVRVSARGRSARGAGAVPLDPRSAFRRERDRRPPHPAATRVDHARAVQPVPRGVSRFHRRHLRRPARALRQRGPPGRPRRAPRKQRRGRDHGDPARRASGQRRMDRRADPRRVQGEQSFRERGEPWPGSAGGFRQLHQETRLRRADCLHEVARL